MSSIMLGSDDNWRTCSPQWSGRDSAALLREGRPTARIDANGLGVSHVHSGCPAAPRIHSRAAQAVGLTIAEIREVVAIRDVGTAPCTHVLELIERRRAEVHSRITELQQLERDLMQLAEQGAGLDPAECDPAGICKIMPSEAGSRRPLTLTPTRGRSKRRV